MFICQLCFFVVSNKDKLWLRIVHHIGVEIDSFLNQNVDAIMEVIVSAKRLPEVNVKMLKICRFCGQIYVS